MEQLSVCRMCLADDVPLQLMENKYLQTMFEKMTDIPFVREDRPVLACYICCARLHNCYKFKNNCILSEEMLQQTINTDGLSLVKLKQLVSCQTFSIVKLANLSCSGVDSANTEEHGDGHPSMIDDVEVKQEIIQDSTNEGLQGNVQDWEEQHSDYKSECDAIPNDAETNDGSEAITTVKSESSEEQHLECNDFMQWSDAEVDTLSEHKSSHDIPLKTLQI